MGLLLSVWYRLRHNLKLSKTSFCCGFCTTRPLRAGHIASALFLLYSSEMKREDFEEFVEEGFERLPKWVREKIKNVALFVEDEPSTKDRKQQRLSKNETLLGLYSGIPLSARGEMYGVGMTMPDTITLYQIPIEEAAREDGKDVRDVIAETIWHEFAHHFGIDEDGVDRRERGIRDCREK